MVTVNGERREGCDGVSLEEMLAAEGFEKKRIAVEINGEIIPKSTYPQTVLREGDTVEVVSFVGGG